MLKISYFHGKFGLPAVNRTVLTLSNQMTTIEFANLTRQRSPHSPLSSRLFSLAHVFSISFARTPSRDSSGSGRSWRGWRSISWTRMCPLRTTGGVGGGSAMLMLEVMIGHVCKVINLHMLLSHRSAKLESFGRKSFAISVTYVCALFLWPFWHVQ